MINFIVLRLLRRLQKLQIEVHCRSRVRIRCYRDYCIYPRQQAHKNESGIDKANLYSVANFTDQQIEETITCSLEKARAAADELGMKELLVKAQIKEKIQVMSK